MLLAEGTLLPAIAAKVAGRLSFAVGIAGNRVGRAYVKPLFAQIYDPLPEARLSPMAEMCLQWFVGYVGIRPETVRACVKQVRPHVRSWSDASGEGRWVAVIVQLPCGRREWTRTQLPDHVAEKLLSRGDHQIQDQELLAVVLALGTWPAVFVGGAVERLDR